jgi:hypothetical protein
MSSKRAKQLLAVQAAHGAGGALAAAHGAEGTRSTADARGPAGGLAVHGPRRAASPRAAAHSKAAPLQKAATLR